MFCQNCGNKVSQDDRFCQVCGASIEIEVNCGSKPNKKSSKRLWVILSLILVVATSVFGIYKYTGGGMGTFVEKKLSNKNKGEEDASIEIDASSDSIKEVDDTVVSLDDVILCLHLAGIGPRLEDMRRVSLDDVLKMSMGLKVNDYFILNIPLKSIVMSETGDGSGTKLGREMLFDLSGHLLSSREYSRSGEAEIPKYIEEYSYDDNKKKVYMNYTREDSTEYYEYQYNDDGFFTVVNGEYAKSIFNYDENGLLTSIVNNVGDEVIETKIAYNNNKIEVQKTNENESYWLNSDNKLVKYYSTSNGYYNEIINEHDKYGKLIYKADSYYDDGYNLATYIYSYDSNGMIAGFTEHRISSKGNVHDKTAVVQYTDSGLVDNVHIKGTEGYECEFVYSYY